MKNNDDEDPSSKQVIVGWDNNNDEEQANATDNDDEDLLEDEYCSVLDDFGCEAYEDLARNLDEKVYRWIRVEAKPDETLAHLESREDVLREIERVKSEQESYGPCQLYPRIWQQSSIKDNDAEEVMAVNGDGPHPVASFSVLQFNALAEGLSAGPNVKTPFTIDKKDKNNEEGDDNNKPKNEPGFGGFSQVSSPEVCLDFSLRRWRLLEVILGISSVTKDHDVDSAAVATTTTEGVFDILALEEIDRFRGFFAPALRIFGYEGIFMPKAKAPGVRLGYYSDGCALFWKTNVFKLVSEERRNFRVGNQVIILATLQHIDTGISLVVAVSHLKAQKSETNEKIRCRQVEELLEVAQTTAARQAETMGLEEDIPILIMGDFNADPPAQLSFPDSSVRRALSNHLEGANKNGNDTTSKTPHRKFQSAYPIDPPKDSFFTTWKTRGTQTVKRIIDYIFYSSGGQKGERLQCTENLSVPKFEELEESKLPGLRYPSDHLMIGAKFQLFK